MKNIFINLLIILLLFIAYYIDFFGWFTGKYVFWLALFLVVLLLFIGFKVLGSPFAINEDKNDDTQN